MNEVGTTPRDRLINDLKLVIADTEDLLKMTADQVGEKASELRVRLQERLDQARVELGHLQQAAVAHARAAGQATDAFVHEHPWKSVGIAAGIGLLVGLLISRR